MMSKLLKAIINLNIILEAIQKMIVIKERIELKKESSINTGVKSDTNDNNIISFYPKLCVKDNQKCDDYGWEIKVGDSLKTLDKTPEMLKKIAEPIMDAHAKERVAYYDLEKYKLKAKLYEPKTILAITLPLSAVFCMLIYYICVRSCDNNAHSNDVVIKNLQEISTKLGEINDTLKFNATSDTNSLGNIGININHLDNTLQQINTSITSLKLSCPKQSCPQPAKTSDCNTNIYNNCNK